MTDDPLRRLFEEGRLFEERGDPAPVRSVAEPEPAMVPAPEAMAEPAMVPAPEVVTERSAGSGSERARTRRLVLLSALLGITGVVLSVIGVRAVLDSRAGTRVDPVTDPEAPGFEALVEPSATLLVADVGGGGLLRSAALVATSSSELGGGVLVIPAAAQLGGGDDLAAEFAAGGVAATRAAVEAGLAVAVDGVATLDDAGWGDLAGPAERLLVEDPAAPGAPVALAPGELGQWVGGATGPAERNERLVAVWTAVLDEHRDGQVSPDSSSAPTTGGGAVATAVGRVATGSSRVEVLPLAADDSLGLAARDVVARVVPFPTAPEPGARARVRLLDGTGSPTRAYQKVPAVTAAGGQVVVIGNAAEEAATTAIVVHDVSAREMADEVRSRLGAGEVREDARSDDTFDVTIVLGADAR